MIKIDSKYSNLIQLAVGGLLFSLSAILVSVVSIGGGGAAFYRMFFAALSFFIILILTGNRVSLSPRDYIYSILTGSVLAFNYIVWHKSIHIVGPGIGSILTNTQIFFMVAVGVILFKEHITIPKVLAVLIGFLGIVALTNNETKISDVGLDGILYGLGSGAAYSIAILFLKNITSTNKFLSMFVVCSTASLFIYVYTSVSNESIAINNVETLVYLLAYGILVQVFGWYLIASSVPHLSLFTVGLVLLVEPLITFLIDITLLGKEVVLIQIFGAILTLFAMYIGLNKEKKNEGNNINYRE